MASDRYIRYFTVTQLAAAETSVTSPSYTSPHARCCCYQAPTPKDISFGALLWQGSIPTALPPGNKSRYSSVTSQTSREVHPLHVPYLALTGIAQPRRWGGSPGRSVVLSVFATMSTHLPKNQRKRGIFLWRFHQI